MFEEAEKGLCVCVCVQRGEVEGLDRLSIRGWSGLRKQLMKVTCDVWAEADKKSCVLAGMEMGSPRDQISEAIHLRYSIQITGSLRKTLTLQISSASVNSETSGWGKRKQRFVCAGHKLNVKLLQLQPKAMTSIHFLSMLLLHSG